MTSKAEKERNKLIQEKSQQILSELLKDDDNKYCVDCDAKGPRWASWNLGVFLCIRCAGIHRNLGVHISKVKSVNLDSWSPEQVAHMQRMGNSQARAVYEANLPDKFKRPQGESPLEAFIRDKYEKKKYIAKEWVQPPTPPPAFDIEEERKKEKEKKKVKPIPKPTAGSGVEVQTNPVPRPSTASNSSALPAAISVDKVLSAKKASTDLLGLNLSGPISGGNTSVSTVASGANSSALINNDDDQFDAFVGCEPINCSDSATKNNGKDPEEDDFFKQKAPEEKKLDKESILKLYESSNTNTNLFQINNNLAGLMPNTSVSVNTPFGAAPLNANATLNSNALTNPLTNVFATTNGNSVSGFANFSQPIPPANNLPYLPQLNVAATQPNFFQSSTNPFLSPGKSLSDNGNLSASGSGSTSSSVNQLQSALGSLDLCNSTLNWAASANTGNNLGNLNNTSASNSTFNNLLNCTSAGFTLPATNPFIQSSSNPIITNGNNLSSASSINTLSSSPFASTNGTSLNGFSKSAADSTIGISNSVPANGSTSGLLDVNWSTLSTNTSTTTTNFATANLWQ